MRKIYLTESQFKKFIAEQVNEVSYDTIDNARDAIEFGKYDRDEGFTRPALYQIENALDTLQETLEQVSGGSRQLGIFMNYVYEMRQYFNRKSAQSENFYDTAKNKEPEYQQYLLNLAREQFGFQGNDLREFANWLGEKDRAEYDNGDFSDPNWNAFLDSITDPDIRKYAENHL